MTIGQQPTVLWTAWYWARMTVGRRGAALLFLAVLDVSYGYSIHAESFRQPPYDLLLSHLAWAVIWTGVGLVCLVQAFMKIDRIAFTLAVALKGMWAALWASLWLVQHAPRGWISVVIWSAFAAFVVVISGWPDIPAPRSYR